MKMSVKLVVFDIDGTLADNSHRVGFVRTKPKNWAAYNSGLAQDGVYQDMVDLYCSFYDQEYEYQVVCATGRNESQRTETLDWMINKNIPLPEHLFMRRDGDFRGDDIVKLELLKDIKTTTGRFPFMWFDDRDRVVNAIRGAGVRVLQCRPGNF
jgi:phosphoglycolate phosphatase-like HAD superfamily hydrolase